MRFHLEMLAKEHEASGAPREEALRRARIEFGGLERMKAKASEARGVTAIENLARDARIALRSMKDSPGFAAVAIATLGLGIGGCAAMFSILNTVLLKPLPFEEPERLVWAQNYREGGLSSQTTRVDNFMDWRAQSESFESMGGYFAFFDYISYLVSDESGDGATRVRGVGITEGFLETLGVKPMLGRGFEAGELIWAGPPVAILCHEFWRSRFGGDPGIVGESITVNGQPTKVVGVMPPSFDFDAVFTPGTDVDMLTPFPLAEQTTNFGNTLAVVGRLKEGATLEQAQSELSVISNRIRETYPNTNRFYHEANTEMLDDRIRGRFRPAFWMLSGAVACVLAIACVNLSSLLIARANGRRKEFALRSAVGARRSHLMRQTLTESVLLAAAGCLVGLPLAHAAVRFLTRLDAFNVPLLETARIDGSVLAFVAAVACVSGLACGILPALQLSSATPGEAMAEGGERGSSGRRRGWLREGLVATEVALACALLIGAGLFIRSFDRLLDVDIGFESDNAVAWRIDGGRGFDSRDERSAYFESVAARVAQMPGVEAVGLTDTLPLGRNREWGIAAKGEEGRPGENSGAFPRIVNHGYADAMGLAVVAGRFFNEFDTSETQRSIVVNEALARRLWGEEDPIGKIVLNNGEISVIGVVENVRHSSLDTGPSPEMYFSMRQVGDYSSVELVVRSRMPAELLASEARRVLQEFDATIPTEDFRSLSSIVDKSVAPQRLAMVTLSAFSGVAVALAAIGLYGVISYSVGRRANEIGIRMAIGARGPSVLWMIMSEGFLVTLAGVLMGVVAALAASRYVGSLLFEVAATDPATFVFNASIVAAVSLLATLLPACRALAVDPVKALRTE